jgi:hypothetical protein
MAKLTSRQYGRAEGAIRALNLVGQRILDLEQRNGRLVETLEWIRDHGGECAANKASAVLAEVDKARRIEAAKKGSHAH